MKMRILVVLATVAVALGYDDVDDTIDVDSIVNNPKLLEELLDCTIDEGPCQDYMTIAHISEAVTDACRECDDIQRHMFKLFLKGIEKKFPAKTVKFQHKYDKDGTHFAHLEEVLEKY